jgi:hypothetical protein
MAPIIPPEVSDANLDELQRAENIIRIDFAGSHVTDAGTERLKKWYRQR